MTNHGETTGSPENGKAAGHDGHEPREDGHAVRPAPVDCAAYDSHGPEHQVTLRTPAELADALPYLLGYRPEDSIVLVALHDRDGRGRFGGRARLGIPTSADDWPSAARQLAHGLVTGSERRGTRPEQIVAYLCQEPAKGETGRQVMERLRPLAQKLRVECGQLDVPVIEALCISDGRFWSYCCVNETCCPAEGVPMGLPGTSVLAAAATYAGLQVRGTLRELRARLQPWETAAALEQELALDTASMALVPRILDGASRADVAEETLELAERIRHRLAEAPVVSGTLMADLRDDELLGHDEAATLILGLQDRSTRDRAAEWMEGEEAAPALRLWRALARRCVGPYGEHAAAPLTLAGWVAWSGGDELEAREALAMALGADPGYLFARLLHQACNESLDPESIRRCLRAERRDRERGLGRRPRGGEPGAEAGPVQGEDAEGVKDMGAASVPETGDMTGVPSEARAASEAAEARAGLPASPASEEVSRPRRRTRSGGAGGSRTRATRADDGEAGSRSRAVRADGRAASGRPRATRGDGVAAGTRSRPVGADGRGSAAGVARSRRSTTDGTRPGPTRTPGTRSRAGGNGPAHRQGSRPAGTHPGGDGAEGDA
ncbi:DUF4192 family protein [Streptomyces sp. NPDC057257]|uniref:DUF4192 domain-containing protein n=1 Tax=Streptomyces sp. NPDC057257 TaxID=3346071 RepID=UPI00363247C4